MIYKNGWKRVKDLGIKAENMNCNIVCLITNNNIIPTNKYIFKDYLETQNPNILCRQMDTVKQYLNYKDINTNAKIDRDRPLCQSGFSKEVINEIMNNENNEIYGWIEIEDENVEWYEYEGMIMTGNQLIYDGGKWYRVYENKNSKRVEYRGRIYNVISINGSIICNGIIMRDFMENL
jgi:hypothetical protein